MQRGLLILLPTTAVTVAFMFLSSSEDAGQKVATALEEMSLVMALLLVHLAVSKYRGEGSQKILKKKTVDDSEADSGTTDDAAESPDIEQRQQAVGKLTTKIRAAVKMGDLQGAEALMRHMHEIGGPPGHYRRACWSVAFGEIVNGFVRDGDAAKACKWLDTFAACAPIIRPSTACVNSVVRCCCNKSLVSEAEAWLARMPTVGIRVDEETYSILINGCVCSGEVSRGIHWLREMRKANMRPSPELNKLVLQACADGRGRSMD
jgi:pentatricopeptide repeat protein